MSISIVRQIVDRGVSAAVDSNGVSVRIPALFNMKKEKEINILTGIIIQVFIIVANAKGKLRANNQRINDVK